MNPTLKKFICSLIRDIWYYNINLNSHKNANIIKKWTKENSEIDRGCD